MTHFDFNPPDAADHVPKLFPMGTAVLWVGCLIVGTIGLRMRDPRPVAAKSPPQPVEAKFVPVRIKSVPVAIAPKLERSRFRSEPSPQPTPAPSNSVPQPAAAPPRAVAMPSPAIGFAVPVEGPVRIVQPREAVPDGNAPGANSNLIPGSNRPTSIAQPLTFGEGDGKQPAPTYPREAVQARQEGTVIVRLVVSEDGRVKSAEAAEPCPWPLLNQSAVRTVREQWRFAPGRERTYTVPIQFELQSR